MEDYDFTCHDNYATRSYTEASVRLKRGENGGKIVNVLIRDRFHFHG